MYLVQQGRHREGVELLEAAITSSTSQPHLDTILAIS